MEKRRARPRASAAIALALASCGAPAIAPSAAERIEPAPIPLAITIDDLPFIGALAPDDDEASAIARIVRAGREADAPLTGFATCHRIDPSGDDLRAWSDAGVPIENHSDAHRAIDDLGLEEWRSDLERCQAHIERITGRAPTFYR